MDDIINWLTALVPTLAVLIGGGIGWVFKTRYEELRQIELTLRDERYKTYWGILEPYVLLFASMKEDKDGGQKKAMQTILSYNYRKTAFELNLIGSDEVVRSWNEMMQNLYRLEEAPTPQGTGQLLMDFGTVLLAIRKDVGNKRTQLKPKDMFRAMIKDIDRVDH